MKGIRRLCQKYDAKVLQQLFKKISDKNGGIVNKDVFPISLVQAVFDAVSGERLDSILSRFNYIDLEYKGSIEDTRNSVPILYRRPNLIITYTDYDEHIFIEQYVGQSISDEEWVNFKNWKHPFTDGNFVSIIPPELIEKITEEITNSKEVYDTINNIITFRIEDSIKPIIGELIRIVSLNDYVHEEPPVEEEKPEFKQNSFRVLSAWVYPPNEFIYRLNGKLNVVHSLSGENIVEIKEPLINIDDMFADNKPQNQLQLHYLNLSKVTSMKRLFRNSKIYILEMGWFDPSNILPMNAVDIFAGWEEPKEGETINKIICTKQFKNYCIRNADAINLPQWMRTSKILWNTDVFNID